MEEIYVKNDQTSTIPFEFIIDVKSFLQIDKTIYWDEPLNQSFDRKELSWLEDVSVEQAFSCEPSADSYPISKIEQEKCVIAVQDLLCQEYPKDSGKWIFKTLHRDKGYIHAILRTSKQDNRVFQRKMMIMIDAKSLQVVNYMDNKPMLEVFDQFQAPEKEQLIKKKHTKNLKNCSN